MYDQLLSLHSIWLRLVKDGLVKNHDSAAFAQVGDYFFGQNIEPTYEGALMILFPGTCFADKRY